MSDTENLPQATFACVKTGEAEAARAGGDSDRALRLLAYAIAESTDEHDRTVLRTTLNTWRQPQHGPHPIPE